MSRIGTASLVPVRFGPWRSATRNGRRSASRPTIWRGLGALLLLAPLLTLLAPTATVAGTPPEFSNTLVANASLPTALAFTPDGRLLITSKLGQLLVLADGQAQPTTALDLGAKVCATDERGLLGVAVDPAFERNRFIYLYYTFDKFNACEDRFDNTNRAPVNRVARFELGADDTVPPASEVVLIDNMPSPNGNHNAGDLHFGKDGFLYASVGDGGCRLGDRAHDFCGPNNDNARLSHVLTGKILRITRNGGIPATNPYQAPTAARCNVTGRTTPGKECRETFASGLRNPFRFAFDPNATGTRFFINDVGQFTWEEIDEGRAGADYGWNIREGFCANGSTTDCGRPPRGLTNPVFAYGHEDTGCSSITGGAFVPDGVWPAAFDGGYLFSDFTCDTIFLLKPGANGRLVRSEFATAVGRATTLTFGPLGDDQALYYTSFTDGGEVRRIAFTGGANRSPIARAAADPTAGNLPLTVAFDAAASTDPDNDDLTHAWDFGDGSEPATSVTATHTYDSAGTFTATLTVADGRGGTDTATVAINAGNTAPVPTVLAPTLDTRFALGQRIVLRGRASDAEDGPLPDASLSWEVILHHDAHTHPLLPPTTGGRVEITGPIPEDLTAVTTSFLELRFTATDADGLSSTVVQELRPHVVDLRFVTQPPGLKLEVNGTRMVAPRTVPSWQGYQLEVSAPDQRDAAGQAMAWVSWSDGLARTHTVTTPAAPTTYTARFRERP